MGQSDSKMVAKEGWVEKFGRVQFLSSEAETESSEIRVSAEHKLDADQFKAWEGLVNELRELRGIREHIILPLKWEESQCLICTQTTSKNTLKICYKKYSCSLNQEVKNRRETKKYFTENEIWCLLYILLKIAAYFQGKSSFLGNVHTSNVLLSRHNKVQLFTQISFPSQMSNIEKIKQSKYEDSYLSPEQINTLGEDAKGQPVQIVLNQNKIDLFNIGLVLLSAIILKDCYYIYNRNQFSINSERFTCYKEELHDGNRYSPILINLVESLLVLQPDLRKTPAHYFKVLEKFEDDILALQDFDKESLSHIEESPQVMNYLQKVSPNTKQTKYLSLARKTKAKETTRQGESPIEQSNEYQPMKVTRKLFSEQATKMTAI